ncbi:MAG: hypothetical protein II399_01605 [Lachnospiraceae bacterium]|nr:hypothetical protein [Lachnospiraceae bacterium]
MNYYVYHLRDEKGEDFYGALHAENHSDAVEKITKYHADVSPVKVYVDKLEDTEILAFTKEMYDAFLSED